MSGTIGPCGWVVVHHGSWAVNVGSTTYLAKVTFRIYKQGVEDGGIIVLYNYQGKA